MHEGAEPVRLCIERRILQMESSVEWQLRWTLGALLVLRCSLGVAGVAHAADGD